MMDNAMQAEMDERWATLSRCGRYRYALGRRWATGAEALFIMLNPSTADATVDDPTLRRCIGFARREGCGAVRTVNLFAWRATAPRDLIAARDAGENIVGPRATALIRRAMAECDGPVIAAWGAHGAAAERGDAVLRLSRRPLHCLGVTGKGHPRHPLYVRADAPLLPFSDRPQTQE
jgi:hypothetical protein